jgi:hypothetical protein
MTDKTEQQTASSKIAGRTFDFDDYKKDDEVSSGLAKTHEQISDNYASSPLDDAVENNVETQNRDQNK